MRKHITALREALQSLKPETLRLLRLAAPLLLMVYCCAVLLYATAGSAVAYQTAILAAQRLCAGLKSGFGVLCLGFLLLECR